eukprot:TRINITY_DN11950_c0_g1_i1.p1 TRINITY_DN11950_c0_g1~~TRINITY_DN11950_c0_g1_i1.p1  ORF type:complete len:734 (+),score=166.75 TRINITY_DN11950_c0_g1_i1:92-2293(+)
MPSSRQGSGPPRETSRSPSTRQRSGGRMDASLSFSGRSSGGHIGVLTVRVLHPEWVEDHNSYPVVVVGSDGAALHREHRRFQELHDALKAAKQPTPPKHVFGSKGDEFLEQRRRELEEHLRQALAAGAGRRCAALRSCLGLQLAEARAAALALSAATHNGAARAGAYHCWRRWAAIRGERAEATQQAAAAARRELQTAQDRAVEAERAASDALSQAATSREELAVVGAESLRLLTELSVCRAAAEECAARAAVALAQGQEGGQLAAAAAASAAEIRAIQGQAAALRSAEEAAAAAQAAAAAAAQGRADAEACAARWAERCAAQERAGLLAAAEAACAAAEQCEAAVRGALAAQCAAEGAAAERAAAAAAAVAAERRAAQVRFAAAEAAGREALQQCEAAEREWAAWAAAELSHCREAVAAAVQGLQERAVAAELRFAAQRFAPPGTEVSPQCVTQRKGGRLRELHRKPMGTSLGSLGQGGLGATQTPLSDGAREGTALSPQSQLGSFVGPPSRSQTAPHEVPSGSFNSSSAPFSQGTAQSPQPQYQGQEGIRGMAIEMHEQREGATYFGVDVQQRKGRQGWRVWRRYTHFAQLRDDIAAAAPGVAAALPPFPGKALINTERQIESRRAMLDVWLADVVAAAQAHPNIAVLLWRFAATGHATGDAAGDLRDAGHLDEAALSGDFNALHVSLHPLVVHGDLSEGEASSVRTSPARSLRSSPRNSPTSGRAPTAPG